MQYLQLSLVACLHLRQRASGASSSHEPLGAEACEAAVLLLRRGLKRKLKAPPASGSNAMPCPLPVCQPMPPSLPREKAKEQGGGRPAGCIGAPTTSGRRQPQCSPGQAEQS